MFFTHIQVLTIAFGRKPLQLQHYNKSVPILKSSHILAQSTFDHPSFILRSSFDWAYENDYRLFGGSFYLDRRY